MMLNFIRKNNFLTFLSRLLVLYLVWGLCRIVFAVSNYSLIGGIAWADVSSILYGGFVFDTVSILYLNIPFILLSLLPIKPLRFSNVYQSIVSWIYVIVNSVGLLLNVMDICYYPFKLARIASDDLHFTSESNTASLFGKFIFEYWWATLLLIALIAILIIATRVFKYSPDRERKIHPVKFYPVQIVLLALTLFFCVFGIRGFISFRGTFPIAMSDVTQYVKPEYSSLTLSNPFCMIRTINRKYTTPEYMPQSLADSLAPTIHFPIENPAVRLNGSPNIVLIVMESFSAAQIKSISHDYPSDKPSITPTIDSLSAISYTFTNAYQNGYRSLDALPSIWMSIPSLKSQFLTLPQSVSSYHPMPAHLRDMGYRTSFFHGGLKETMSFYSLGKMSGIEESFSMEDYETEHGKGDYDGYWGIFDHKFLPYMGDKLNSMPQPFFATLFTLSSHHPYYIPTDVEHLIPANLEPYERAIRYADYSLNEFLREASTKDWYANTLFIITADHTSDKGAQVRTPYHHRVPIMFHYTGGELHGHELRGRDDRAMQHINIAPTLMRMVGQKEPLMGFGMDIFNDTREPWAIFHHNEAFNYISDDKLYRFDETKIIDVSNYRTNTPSAEPADSLTNSSAVMNLKALVQTYFHRISKRSYK